MAPTITVGHSNQDPSSPHKNQYTTVCLPSVFGPDYHVPPYYVWHGSKREPDDCRTIIRAVVTFSIMGWAFVVRIITPRWTLKPWIPFRLHTVFGSPYYSTFRVNGLRLGVYFVWVAIRGNAFCSEQFRSMGLRNHGAKSAQQGIRLIVHFLRYFSIFCRPCTWAIVRIAHESS